jgi:hypothetical protein
MAANSVAEKAGLSWFETREAALLTMRKIQPSSS